jgi:hypothetical protein
MIRKSRMVLAAPDPLLTPPPSSSPPKTAYRSYSIQTRSQNEEKNHTPQTVPAPQRRTRHRLSHRPHRQCRCGVIPLPQHALHPTDHVQQETHPTYNPPQSARKNGAGEARRRGGRRRGRPPSADRHRPRGTRRHPAPATGTPQQQDPLHIAHLHKRPTLPETRTQPATGINRRTPTTRCHSAWASPGRHTQTDASEDHQW